MLLWNGDKKLCGLYRAVKFWMTLSDLCAVVTEVSNFSQRGDSVGCRCSNSQRYDRAACSFDREAQTVTTIPNITL